MSKAAVRIIPAETGPHGHTLTRGTRVLVGEHELSVSRIVLTAEVNDVWRCTLTLTGAIPPELTAQLDAVRVRPTWRDVRELIVAWWKS